MVRLLVDTKDLLTTAEAAKRLQIGYATLFRWIKSGKIVPLKIDGRTLIPESEVTRLNRERR